MTYSGINNRYRRYKIIASAICITALFFLFIGVAAGSSGGEQPSKGWVSTDTFRVINFTILLAGLVYLLRKPVSQAMNDRIKGIKGQLSELEAKKEEAERQLAEYNLKFQQLDREAEKIIAEYIQQGNEAKARIIQEAETAAKKLEAQARRNIDHEFEKTKQKLREEVLEQALTKAEEIIKNKITTQDHDRLVDEYLKKVVAS
ncbi:MAG: F0F1 ATP synthase subunit B [Desulfobacterales bacterium]|jgi:F-type H+-transporting ATPase subunit b